MSNKNIIIIAVSTLLLSILIFSRCLELQAVSDLNWTKSFNYDSEEAYGTFLFKNMLEKTFQDTEIIEVKNDSLFNNLDGTNNLYIYLDRRIDLTEEMIDSIFGWTEKGNKAIFIGNISSSNLVMDDLSTDTLDVEFENLTDSSFVFSYAYDSSLLSQKIDSFKNYHESTTEASIQYFPTLANNIDGAEQHITIGDSLSIMISFQSGDGEVFFHTIPEMFCNIASIQDFYLPHYNYVISNFNPDTIYLDKSNLFRLLSNRNQEKSSPIEFILSQPPLKWAYYTLLLGILIFVAFGSKRKQKAIPTVEKNENTTLEYVGTMSSLYQSQNQNRKLIVHMRHIFYQRMKSKYYLDHKIENYNQLLSRKSKVDQDLVDKLLHKLESADHYEFTDDQLISINKQLDKFYKNCK